MVKTPPHNAKSEQIQRNSSNEIPKKVTKKINKEIKEIKISSNIFIQNNLFKQGMGLTFRKKMNDFAMIFPFNKSVKIAVTMFFVFFPIDVIFLDEHNKVIELKENFKPFRNYYSQQKMKTFIELPENTIKKYKIKLNDSVSWSKNSLILIKQR